MQVVDESFNAKFIFVMVKSIYCRKEENAGFQHFPYFHNVSKRFVPGGIKHLDCV